jgi:hypothetical protein
MRSFRFAMDSIHLFAKKTEKERKQESINEMNRTEGQNMNHQ